MRCQSHGRPFRHRSGPCPCGPGFHGHPGYVASWRPLDERSGAIKIGGSPFKTLADAEEACNIMLKHLNSGAGESGKTPGGDGGLVRHDLATEEREITPYVWVHPDEDR